MILDVLDRGHHYTDMHPLFGHAFDFLRRPALASLTPGRHEIEGDRVYALVEDAVGRGREEARLEHHRRYIDIQVCVEGEEQIGWLPLGCCNKRAGDFDPARDVGFFTDPAHSWFTLTPGTFAVFSPADAHAPLAGNGRVRKVVVKVMV